MLEEKLNQRKQQYEVELGRLALEERGLTKRLADILANGASCEGAINEIQNVLRDLHTEAAIDAAKEQQNV